MGRISAAARPDSPAGSERLPTTLLAGAEACDLCFSGVALVMRSQHELMPVSAFIVAMRVYCRFGRLTTRCALVLR